MKDYSTNELIKEKAKELAFKYGLKSVSLDEIAKLSRISKKTIYKFFDDKNAIIQTMVDELIQSHNQLFKATQSTANDAIDEVLKQDSCMSLICKNVRPSLLHELEKFFPISWKQLKQYNQNIYESNIGNLQRGKEEGLYRADIDIRFISDLRMHQLINVLKPEILTSNNLSVTRLATELTVLYLHAVTTEKGKKLLDKYLNEKKRTDTSLQDNDVQC